MSRAKDIIESHKSVEIEVDEAKKKEVIKLDGKFSLEVGGDKGSYTVTLLEDGAVKSVVKVSDK